MAIESGPFASGRVPGLLLKATDTPLASGTRDAESEMTPAVGTSTGDVFSSQAPGLPPPGGQMSRPVVRELDVRPQSAFLVRGVGTRPIMVPAEGLEPFNPQIPIPKEG